MKLKTIPNNYGEMMVSINRLKHFINVCPVTKEEEKCYVEIRYQPNEKLLDIVDFRKYIAKKRNQYIEEICKDVIELLDKQLNPKIVEVTVFLDDEKLTPWNVKMMRTNAPKPPKPPGS